MGLKLIETGQGQIQVQEEEKIFFPNGIYAFENLKHAYIIPADEEGIFKILQSETEASTAFIIINPYLIKEDFTINMEEQDLKEIGLTDQEEALHSLEVYCIVTITENSLTANFLGPIVINTKNRIGKQIINNVKHYSTQHDILKEMALNKNRGEVNSVSLG